MTTAQLDGATIGYTERGSGPPLVLLPGLGCTRALWEPQIDRFSADHRVIAVDPRGAGDSSPLRGRRDVLERQAGDIAALLEVLDVGEAVVCGVSFGGVLAQLLALNHPEKVKALVTVDSFSDTRPRSAAEAVNLVLLYATGWLWLFPGLMRPGVRSQYRRWPAARAYMDAMLTRMRRAETVRIRYALNAVRYTPRLPAVRCPTLVLSADDPRLQPMSRRIAEAVPRARMETIPDSFDPSNRCNPEEFDRRLAGFLAEVGG
ncbi:alpha/beta fold hydrolase [Streptomonospora sp. PA3]|uniref:alpha/beta fold hydrolase n=1 Tax=Streptomonospora sp. PA3 TaxID=2607326 RepID=UPI0012DF2244|nr:alpha/beta hydrolase [Streptomonospora sp. PA3]MUL43690.1 alpha/beta fold hydrolase [Streptomonospora sp. PA3]